MDYLNNFLKFGAFEFHPVTEIFIFKQMNMKLIFLDIGMFIFSISVY